MAWNISKSNDDWGQVSTDFRNLVQKVCRLWFVQDTTCCIVHLCTVSTVFQNQLLSSHTRAETRCWSAWQCYSFWTGSVDNVDYISWFFNAFSTWCFYAFSVVCKSRWLHFGENLVLLIFYTRNTANQNIMHCACGVWQSVYSSTSSLLWLTTNDFNASLGENFFMVRLMSSLD